MSQKATELSKTLTVGQAVGLAICIVVGSGLLVLPGLAYQQVGGAAIYAWVIDALLVIPLLVIFAYLGANYPGAGGIAGFVQEAFSRPMGAATEVLLLGTFSLGIPSIAVTGGNYFAMAIGGGEGVSLIASLGLLIFAGMVNYLGAKVSGNVQQVLSYSLTGLLLFTALLALWFGDRTIGTGVAPIQDWMLSVPALGMVFFSYTGWEMLSFTTEEYKNPKRDFPIAVGISFVTIILVYLMIALAVQYTLPHGDSRLGTAPIAALLMSVFGPLSGKFVAVVGVVIIAANLIGATWAASRLVFASAREGLLPGFLSRVDKKTRSPQMALLTVILVFSAVIALHFSGAVSLGILLQVAGQNFFILYGLSVIAYLKLVRRPVFKAFGLFTLAVVMLTMGTFGWWLFYPLALMLFGSWMMRIRRRRNVQNQTVHLTE
ncbi:APC family permease [Lihuaxuella thermophila]|uniref:Amino acid efflux transporter n=1 Tax=Lihuaxuella thermophila TaxID=1173111 RepID=A0A1H8CGS8_9BACL|nr:APC family permease [Lihuaxuella thermophila]SEM94491.1 amino acid efflux transporter [Lihuaxuella thermophila]